MKFAPRLCLVFLVITSSVSAAPAVLFEQPVDASDNGVYSNIEGQQMRDDSTLSLGASITKVAWWGMYNDFDASSLSPMAFSVGFFADDAGSLGAQLLQETVTVDLVDTGLICSGWLHPDNPIYGYEATLSSALSVAAGERVWIVIAEADTRTTAGGATQWLWNRSTSMNANDYAFVLKGDPTPIPVPGALLLATLGLGLVCRRRGRKTS